MFGRANKELQIEMAFTLIALSNYMLALNETCTEPNKKAIFDTLRERIHKLADAMHAVL